MLFTFIICDLWLNVITTQIYIWFRIISAVILLFIFVVDCVAIILKIKQFFPAAGVSINFNRELNFKSSRLTNDIGIVMNYLTMI
jgi:hypothetical protein